MNVITYQICSILGEGYILPLMCNCLIRLFVVQVVGENSCNNL